MRSENSAWRKAREAARSWVEPRRASLCALVVLSVGLGLPRGAQAAGVEDAPGGTIALGRAANYARVNDFMSITQNPANMTLVGGDIGLDLRLPIFNGCFNRTKRADTTYLTDPNDNTKSLESFSQSCNVASPFPIGNGGIVVPVLDSARWGKLALGLGVFTPNGVAKLKYGSETVRTLSFSTAPITNGTTTGLESPGRYLLIERQVLAAFGLLGVAYSPIPQFRVGVSAGVGFANVEYSNVASAQKGFDNMNREVLNKVSVQDNAIPRVVASVASTPIDSVDLFATFTYTGDIHATGHTDVTANGYKGEPLNNCRDAKPGPHCRIDHTVLDVPYQRYSLDLGARYAQRRAARGAKIDPIVDEVWDVEFDGYWSQTSHVKDFALTLYDPNDANKPQVTFNNSMTAPLQMLPQRAALPHNWRDTWGFRFGGDYNFVRRVLSGRAGLSYETQGVPNKYANLDYWPMQKVGLHFGLTWRIIEKLDLHLAYAHIFNSTINQTSKSGIPQVTAIMYKNVNDLPAVNEGKFSSRIDIISMQLNYHWK